MPKIIKNVREQLLAEAKKQVFQNGYAKTTVRSVAGGCGVGVGTVYNYFQSKDMLIASFVADDWSMCVQEISAFPAEDPESFIRFMCDSLNRFAGKHHALFNDPDAAKVFSAVFSERHTQLRYQLASLVLPICGHIDYIDRRFLAEFIADSMLTWSSAKADINNVTKILMKLLKSNE